MIDLLRRCQGFASAVARFSGRRGVLAAFLAALGALLESVGIVLLIPLLAVLLASSAGNGGGIQEGWMLGFLGELAPLPRLFLIIALFAAAMAVRSLVLWWRDLLLGRLQVEFVEHQRSKIARKLAAARWEELAAIGHGRVTHLLGGDIQRCGSGVHFLYQGGVAAVMLAAYAILAFALAPMLTLIAAGLLLIAVLALFSLLRRSNEAGSRLTEAQLSMMVGVGRFLGGMKVAMTQNLERAMLAAFERDLQASARQQIGFIAQQSLLRATWGMVATFVAAATLLIGYAVLNLPVPLLLTVLLLLARITAPLMQIQMGLQQIAFTLPAWETVAAMERELSHAAAPQDAARGPPIKGSICFEEVVFRHGDARGRNAGVMGLNLRFDAGEIVGVTGPSGAGKTTMADLLTGLLTPQSGRILIGGVSLTKENVQLWRDQISYVAQDPVMFNDSVRGNLLWAAPTADQDAIAEALRISGGDRLVERLPLGLATVVGERGALISGGERQRLALARALLRKPSILILDEATSAVDISTERQIFSRLRQLNPRPTIVVIAHRSESLALCDRVVTLVEGRVTKDSCAAAA